ncbi:MAG: triose-phosphate isomerase [Deltaproteobacteria bacterium]|nr:triose-phosphate isomerase [Deltaproteobacteria bacterium]MCB9478882.1 triose-phosphate isomerase [Deltaproteobacteria bacterium]MCB9489388.1 triose-phosphate isomerase [Deltaproteobacteria bacterium]
MQRTPLIAGNWKMNLDLTSAGDLAKALHQNLDGLPGRDVVVIPPTPLVHAVATILDESTIKVGAQEVRAEASGAYTGDTSIEMIKSIGATYCLVGHSERREYHDETNKSCCEKIRALLNAGITPIYCVGEKLATREAGETLKFVEEQLRVGLGDIDGEEVLHVVVAYEPVWAIGTGKVATPEQAQEVHGHIRGYIGHLFDPEDGEGIRILYGGSVNAENIDGLMACPDIDGALVGGASLKADVFERIVKFEDV